MKAVTTPRSGDETPGSTPGAICAHCGREIDAPRDGQRYCNRRCRMAVWERKNRPAEHRRRVSCGRAPQAWLFDETPSIEERAAQFHRDHPEVYRSLRRLALEKVRRGAERIGMKALWEVARWELEAGADDGFRLNNNYTAWYARRLMELEPELRGAFETRKRRSAG